MFHQVPQVPDPDEVQDADLRATIHKLERCLDQLRGRATLGSATSRGAHLTEDDVRKLVRARRLRVQQLGADLFSDPAWDILLEAFACDLAQKRISVSGLCSASSVPATTALRWIEKLEEDGWLRRDPDRLDRRRCWLELTPIGSERLRHYFEAVWPHVYPL